MSESRAFRRCHVCGSVCEQAAAVQRCDECGKPFAPFYYYDDSNTPILNAALERPRALRGEYRPIQGLTAYWAAD